MSDTNSILEIQRGIVALERAKRIAEEQKNQRDIRNRIARSGFYNPESDPAYQYQHYPRYVKVGEKNILVQNEDEERRVLGKPFEPAKAVEVDVSAAMKEQPAAPAKPRGRPKKAVTVELPPDLG